MTAGLLKKIDSPEDIKKLNYEALNELAAEIREYMIEVISKNGGHLAPNLGVVELTLALHKVFNCPKDKIIWDVGHQSYIHKIITGRREAFKTLRQYNGISGFPKIQESKFDAFGTGHSSTSISAALGMAIARDLKGEDNEVVAVIGDGSLSGGEAFEGLDNAGEFKSNFIVIVNDNEMSIAENHGGLYKNLKELRDSNGQCECNFFKAMGLDYMYVNDGNNVEALVKAFSKVKDIQHPVVVHINTLKGKGYKPAEQDKETFHWLTPFNIETGKPKFAEDAEDYSEMTAQYLLKKMKEDKRVVTITSGTPAVLGFTPDRRQKAGKQFVDVGIAEEHAVALASGIAANGGKPVYGVYSTFIQRSYDQLSQDLCINNNPAVLLVFGGTLSGMNDVTHLCFFDIPLISNIPNMVYLAPTCKEEYLTMLEWGIRQNEHPVAIRVPATDVISCGESVESDYSVLNRYKVAHRGSKVAILALGSFFELGQSVLSLLKEKAGVDATLINPRYITGVDNELMDELKADHELVITLEDGVLDGGFGEKIARYYGASDMKVLNYGAKKEFVDRYDIQELLRANHLTDEQIVEDITAVIG